MEAIKSLKRTNTILSQFYQHYRTQTHHDY